MYCGVLFCCSLLNISLYFPLKFLESLGFFCRNDGWLIENHGLGLARDTQWQFCSESSTGNTPNTPQFIWPICPNRPIFGVIFEKSSHHMSIVHDTRRGSDTFLGLFMLGCFCIWNASATNFENRCRILSFIKPFITVAKNSNFCPKNNQNILTFYLNTYFYKFLQYLVFNLDI